MATKTAPLFSAKASECSNRAWPQPRPRCSGEMLKGPKVILGRQIPSAVISDATTPHRGYAPPTDRRLPRQD